MLRLYPTMRPSGRTESVAISRGGSVAGSEGMSKAEIREMQAQEKRLQEWEENRNSLRSLAHSGLHVQEEELEMFSLTRRLVKQSYEQHELHEKQGGTGEEGEAHFNVKTGLTDENLEVIAKEDLGHWHGICFSFYSHQTIWGMNAQQPDSGGGRRRAHLMFLSGSDGNVHVACLDDVPGNKLKGLGHAKSGVEEEGSKEDRPDSPPLWTKEWVFFAKLLGAGGLDRYMLMRMHVLLGSFWFELRGLEA